MVSESVRAKIPAELARIEREKDVRVLYACESGSRAWGFASEDSDYDVRFIYGHARDWYLSILMQRDVIEETFWLEDDEIDLSGWELRKALRLFRRSNPPLLEWLRSPIVYAQDAEFVSGVQALQATYYSPIRSFKHYLHMAEGNVREYLKGDEVWVKKYFYVLRPMLACRWIERNPEPVPMEFDRLYPVVDSPELLAAIEDLVVRKKAGAELDRGPKIEVISDYIEAEMPRLQGVSHAYGRPEEPAPTELDAFFRRVVEGR